MSEANSIIYDKRIRRESKDKRVVLSRGKELPKAGTVTGVKS